MRNKAIRKIVLATAGVIFSLATAVSSTYAWFLMNSSVEEEVSSFTIGSPSGAEFDLYYLRDFTVGLETRDGNFNSAILKYAGYEISYTNANFVQVELDEEGFASGVNNPTDIDQLWPKHRLTYAVVIKSGTASKLDLQSWSESTNDEIKINEDTNVSLTWAINMYGQAYSVTATGSVTSDIATAYASYRSDAASLDDAFTSTPNDPQDGPVHIIETVPVASALQRSILFFTIEFSNDPGTFYSYNPLTGYYLQDEDGNSNCYESLRISSLVFQL